MAVIVGQQTCPGGHRGTKCWIDVSAKPALPNDEAQTPRWRRPDSMVFSNTLRVIGVVCSAWLGCLLFLPPMTS